MNHEEHTSTVLGKYTPWRALNAESRGPDTTQQLKGKQLPFTHVAKAPSQIRKVNYNKSELSPFSLRNTTENGVGKACVRVCGN